MKFSYGMGKKVWRQLLETLHSTDGITITYYPEVDTNGEFADFKYILFEYNNQFFYLQEDVFTVSGITIIAYQKVNPYEKHQYKYPARVQTFEEILSYINESCTIRPLSYISTSRTIRPFEDTYNQRIYLTELYCLKNGKTDLWRLENELADNREKDILTHLSRIEMIQNSNGYKVLRFWHNNGEKFFDYECNSKRITG